MRRLARHLFTLCSAVSLVLFVAVCVLWVRSYQTADVLAGPLTSEPRAGKYLNTRGSVASSRGRLAFRWMRYTGGPPPPGGWRTLPPRPFEGDGEERRAAAGGPRRACPGAAATGWASTAG